MRLLIQLLTPFLLALYPVLYFYHANIGQMFPSEMILPGGLLLSATAILLAISALFFRDRVGTLLFTSIVLSLFFSAQTVLDAFKNLLPGRGLPLLATAVVFITLCVSVYLLRRRSNVVVGTFSFISLTTLTAYALLLGQFALSSRDSEVREEPESPPSAESQIAPHGRPDIYYIILDGHGRSDVLERMYGVNSSEFLAKLSAMGFYIADKSNANYGQTLLSLGSALNMHYLDMLSTGEGKRSKSRGPAQHLLFRNKVAPFLKRRGYKFVFFPSGYSGTELPGVDERHSSPYSLSEYQNILLAKSVIPELFRFLPGKGYKNIQFSSHRAQVRFTLEHLPDIPKDPAPTFTFAHILSPHPPFLFQADGTDNNPETRYELMDGSFYMRRASRESYREGYAQQVTFLDREILVTIEKIIEHAPDSIIILQGDHGPGSQLRWGSIEKTDPVERLAILNAYRVPPLLRERLYPSITPVNSFRLLFQTLFNSPFEPLPDKSYLSTWNAPYNFVDMTDVIKK